LPSPRSFDKYSLADDHVALTTPANPMGAVRMKVGDTVDDFEVLDQHGESVTLTGLLESGPLVLYFYIKAKTPG
jgi:hypothetical protein